MIDLSRAIRNTDPAVLKDIPGPGYYSSPSPRQIGSYVFGRSERTVSDISAIKFEDIPGPGAYNSGTSSTVPPYKTPFNTSSARFSTYECKWKPGPGSYHSATTPAKPRQKVVQTLCVHPSPVPASIPLLERHELAIYDGRDARVSPAEYSPNIDQVKPRNPASLFSKSKIPRLSEKPFGSENLGPGSYLPDLQPHVTAANNFPKAERFKDRKNNLPGPGSYEPKVDIVKPSAPKFYVSRLDRSFDIAKKVVQEYPTKVRKIPERVRQNAVFASGSQRDCNKALSASPVGPGRYDIEYVKKEGYSFHVEPRFREKEESPVGPGTYDLQDYSKRSSPAKIKSARFQELSDLYVHSIGEQSIPGPGNYELRPNWHIKHRGVSFELTSSRTADRKQHSPDPGQYHTEVTQSSGTKIGSDSRFKSGHGSYIKPVGSGEFIGPGAYKHKVTMVKRTHNISWI